MSSLLTLEEYEAIAESLTLPTTAFIDGRARAASDGKTFDTMNPATGRSIAQIAACEEADVDHAVLKARESFESGVWSRMHPAQRKAVLIRLVKLMKRNQHELAVLESIESGKPIADIETIDENFPFQNIVEAANEIDDRALARTGDARDTEIHTQWEDDVDRFKVVTAGIFKGEPCTTFSGIGR